MAGHGTNGASAQQRITLVVGNGAYTNVGALPNPPNDARLIANTLRSLSFDVIEHIDVDQKTLKRAVSEFGDKLEAAGKDAVGLFYYAGHGVQVRDENFLIPVNADIEREKDVDIESVSVNAVLDNMAFAGNRLNIVILDARRNNPYKAGFRSAARGLAKMQATKGTLVAYATAPGDVAADGTGRNSPYS
ncbi:MAG: caspase family protein, partial [Rhodospirillaceae bacterium]|nr:caspase family protein [Rhodospirillaceae bacterium]